MTRLLFTLLMLTLLPVAHADELGRLFNTPQQRQQLEFQVTNSRGAIDSPEAVKRNYIIVNGVVQKQGGNRTVWINGAPQTAERGNDKTPASVPVSLPGKTEPVQLKVGQRLILEAPATEKEADSTKPLGDD